MLKHPVLRFVALLCLIAVILLLMPTRHRGENATRVKCASNLKQIGQALLIYANEHDGELPPNFATLLANADLVGQVFVCSNSNDKPVASRNLKTIRTAFASGGHNSYAYAPPPKKWAELDAADVIAFESTTHEDGMMNVLFGDGHVEFIAGEAVYSIFDQYGQGVRPIRLQPGSP